MENISLKKVLTKLLSTRMVIESGTNGIWTYRKWSDGTAELWGTTQAATYNITNQYGGTYYTSASISVLTGIFQSIDSVSINRANGGQGTVWVSPYADYSTIINGTLSMFISNGVQWPNASLAFSIDIKGRWANHDSSSSTLDITGFSQQQMSKQEVENLITASGNIFKENDTWVPSDLT